MLRTLHARESTAAFVVAALVVACVVLASGGTPLPACGWAAAFLLLAMPADLALGHPLAPSFLDIRVQEVGAELSFKTPAQTSPGALVPTLPSECEPVGKVSTEREGTGVVRRWRVRCPRDAWLGRAVGIRGLSATGTNGIVRVSVDGVPLLRVVVEPSRPASTVPQLPAWTTTAETYFAFGVRHIVFGLDHLLFITGLLLLVRGLRRVAETVTAFTLGHSLTLALAVLGFVRVPTAPVELGIAASLMWVAVEALRPDQSAQIRGWSRPRLVAVAFGLLHGLGFAGALSELGLPAGDMSLALLGFNAGIEVGQLVYVLMALGAVAAWRWLGAGVPVWCARATAYAVGSMGFYWLLQRTLAA